MEGVVIIAAAALVVTGLVAAFALWTVHRQAEAHRRDAESWAMRFMSRTPDEYLAARSELLEQDRRPPSDERPPEPEEPDPEVLEARRREAIERYEAAMAERGI